jgi:hypothetical protein
LHYGLKGYVNIEVQWVGGATPTAYFYDSDGNEVSQAVLGDRSVTELLALFDEHKFKAEVESIVYPDEPLAVREYGGHTYKFWITENYFPAAEEFVAAKQPGGYIVTITSASEQAFLGNTLKELGIIKAWLGGKDKEEGKWLWLGGPEKDQLFWDAYATDEAAKAPGFKLWFPNEPNNADNEDCSLFFPDGWNDASCDTEKASLVVEFGNEPLNEPATTEESKPDL